MKSLINKASFYQYFPGLSIVLFVLLSIFTDIQSLAYIAIFYWCIFRFDLVPISLLMCLGIVYDSLCSHFLGEETFLYLILMSLVYLDHHFLLRRDFSYLWKNISILIITITGCKWMLASSLNLGFFIPWQVFDTCLGIFSFPIFVSLMAPMCSKLSN